MSIARHRRTPAFDDPAPIRRRCDHPDCEHAGEYRAPKGRSTLRNYYWFCLDHVREYNRGWDYYAGMSADQIEQQMRADTVWRKPTWPLGSWRHEHRLRDGLYRKFGLGTDEPEGPEHSPQPRRPPSEQQQAMDVLALAHPLDFVTLKARYKALVKQHHPDANGGSRDAEEKLKTINRAYSVLKAALAT
jgi:DnaJ-domain-containing protein 1